MLILLVRILTSRVDTLAPLSLVLRHIVLDSRKKTTEKNLNTIVANAFQTRLRVHGLSKAEWKDKLERCVRHLDNRWSLIFRRREIARRVREMRDEAQFRKEELFRTQLRADIRRFKEEPRQRFWQRTSLAMLHETLRLRRLHYAAWPNLYPEGLPDLPPLDPKVRSWVKREDGKSWKTDMHIVGYPNLLDIPPSRSTITRLKPTDSYSSQPRPFSFLRDFYEKNPRTWTMHKGDGTPYTDISPAPPPPDPEPEDFDKIGINNLRIDLVDPHAERQPDPTTRETNLKERQRTRKLQTVAKMLYRPTAEVPSMEKAVDIVGGFRTGAREAELVAAELTKIKTKMARLGSNSTSSAEPPPEPPKRKRKYKNADEAVMEDLKNKLEAVQSREEGRCTRSSKRIRTS